MKLRKEDIQSISEEPLNLFYQGIKSPATKEKYTRTLRRILCDLLEEILVGTFEERAAQFVSKAKSDPSWATGVLLSMSRKLRKRTELQKTDKDYLSPNSFSRYFKPVKKLLDMNEVPIAWKRVYSTFPQSNGGSTGRGYTREEIKKMLKFTNGINTEIDVSKWLGTGELHTIYINLKDSSGNIVPATSLTLEYLK